MERVEGGGGSERGRSHLRAHSRQVPACSTCSQGILSPHLSAPSLENLHFSMNGVLHALLNLVLLQAVEDRNREEEAKGKRGRGEGGRREVGGKERETSGKGEWKNTSLSISRSFFSPVSLCKSS